MVSKLRIVFRVARWGAVLVAVATLVFLLTPLGRYLVRAGYEEARILLARRPIAEVAGDEQVSAATRAKLALVLQARDYAEEVLGLTAGSSFTQFTQLRRDTLVLVLSAAPQDALVQHTWWFPVVGRRLPYKGYFDYGRADREAKALESRGYDTYLRPASAFSTLGWFNDPLLSTTVAADSAYLVDTVIHEITHSTYFGKGQAAFNESFASFVGARGAAAFFRDAGLPHLAELSDDRWHDQRVLGEFWSRLYRGLDSTFRGNPESRERRLELRDSIYSEARRALVDSLSGELRRVSATYLGSVRLDNAALLGRRVYASDLELFDLALEAQGNDMRAMIATVIQLARGAPADPTGALREWLAERR